MGMALDQSATGTGLPVGKLPAGLLGRLLAAYSADDPDVLVGPGLGRDAAAIALGDQVLVAKTDPITFASHQAAAYLVDVNANDVACLGARPRWLLVTLLLPPGTSEAAVAAQFAELGAACRRRGIVVVGGHSEVTAGLDRSLLVGTLLGTTTRERLLRPGGAAPGDRLLLTKGLAVEGTALLAAELGELLADRVGPDLVGRARALLGDPGISVVAEAEQLLEFGGVTALHDPTEGGLATAVWELAGANGCGAAIAAGDVPVLAETGAICGALGIDPFGLLASGSLLVACREESAADLLRRGRAAAITITEIGRLVAKDEGVVAVEHGVTRPLPAFETDEASRALATWVRHDQTEEAS